MESQSHFRLTVSDFNIYNMKQLEKEFVEKLKPIFKKHFIVRDECYSDCKKNRIDLILQLKNTDYFFGIECKIPNKKRGEEIGRFVEQAIRYTNYKFDVLKNKTIYKKIPIFICPALSYDYFILNEKETLIKDSSVKLNQWIGENNLWHQDRHNRYCEHHTFNGFLGNWNIGEVRKISTKDYIFSLSNKIIFSSIKGIHNENYNFIIKDYE